MPSTINGIGTRYVGEKNREVHRGVCEECKREGTLQDYDTRLWFCIVFIPVIPLGRKHVISYCGICTRHRVLSQTAWEDIQRSAIAGQMQAMDEDPESPEEAIKLLGTLTAFHKYDQAQKIAAWMEERFANNAPVLLAVGGLHEEIGNLEQADARFRKAWQLSPNDPAAKRAAAVAHIRAGQPQMAWQLLTSPPVIATAQVPGIYLEVAKAFQKNSQHTEALQVFGQLLEQVPALGKDRNVRKLVQQSERAAATDVSILPRVPLLRRRLVVPGIIAALILGPLLYYNWHIAKHRQLHIVNGLGVPVKVTVDDARPITVQPGASQSITTAEGDHHATLSAVDRKLAPIDFRMESGFFGRFYKNPAFVLNPAGCALLCREEAIYTPRGNGPAGELQIYVGQSFLSLEHVNYCFREFPRNIKMKMSDKAIRKFRVTMLPMPPGHIFNLPAEMISADDQLRFAEIHLDAEPRDDVLPGAYAEAASNYKEVARGREFLAKQLQDRPVNVSWHRAYQTLVMLDQNDDALIRQYQKLLDADPKNSGLLYLRGRLATGRREAHKFSSLAVDADPSNAFALFSRGFYLELAGDFEAALRDCARASELRPQNTEIRDQLISSQLANRQYAQVERSAQDALATDPTAVDRHVQLLEALVLQGRQEEARDAVAQFRRKLEVEVPPEVVEAVSNRIEGALLYMEHRYDEMLSREQQMKNPELKSMSAFPAKVEWGNLGDAASDLDSPTVGEPGILMLTLSLAFRRQGNGPKADAWLDKARDAMAAGNPREEAVGRLLANATTASYEEIDDVLCEAPMAKAVVLVALAQKRRADRAQLLELAGKLNFRLSFPHNLLVAEIGRLKSAP